MEPTLKGSDPFPFGRDYRRVGGFGFLAGVEPDPARPWGVIRDWLAGGGVPVPYGRAVGLGRFTVNQLWIQVHNRLPRKARS